MKRLGLNIVQAKEKKIKPRHVGSAKALSKQYSKRRASDIPSALTNRMRMELKRNFRNQKIEMDRTHPDAIRVHEAKLERRRQRDEAKKG